MQSQDSPLDLVKAKLRHLKRQAWKPIIQVEEGALNASKISGKAWLNRGETWPICPNCQNPLRLVLQLNLQELPESLEGKFGSGILQLFCCESDFDIETDEYVLMGNSVVSSAITSSSFTYINELDESVTLTRSEPYIEIEEPEQVLTRVKTVCCLMACEPFANNQLARIIQPDDEPVEVEVPEMENFFPAKLIVGWEEMEEYPHPEEIREYGIALDEREYEILEEYELSAQVGDKLAGWLSWAQYIEYPNCPTCNRKMNQFIFQFESDSDENFPYPHHGLGVGYLVQCPEHKEQVAFFCQFT